MIRDASGNLQEGGGVLELSRGTLPHNSQVSDHTKRQQSVESMIESMNLGSKPRNCAGIGIPNERGHPPGIGIQSERELFLVPESHNHNSCTEWTTHRGSKVMGIPVLGLGWSLTPVG